jgi:hypothetical protein
MSELLTPVGAEQKFNDEHVEPSIDSTVREPVLITEQQVLFATAAAVPLQPVRREWTRAIGAGVRAIFTSSTDAPRERKHYPARNDFLESSRMAREMYRL